MFEHEADETIIEKIRMESGLQSTSAVVPTAGISAMFDRLARKGCCAWVGRTVCKDPPTIAVGGNLYVQAVLALTGSVPTPNGRIYLGVLCQKHGTGGEDAAIRDMPADELEASVDRYLEQIAELEVPDDRRWWIGPIEEIKALIENNSRS